MKITYYAQSDILSIELSQNAVTAKHPHRHDPMVVLCDDADGQLARIDIVAAKARGIETDSIDLERFEDESVTELQMAELRTTLRQRSAANQQKA
jgi:uncharacterized protein YuzE